MKYNFRPRRSFSNSLTYLAQLDPSIVDELKEAIQILVNGDKLPAEFDDHKLEGNLSNYRDFHLRDTPKGHHVTEINDVVVVYKYEEQDLILIAVDIGSHEKLFHGRYRKQR